MSKENKKSEGDAKLVKWFEELGKDDVEKVGGKSANLGELASELDVPVLPGFATTTYAYDKFVKGDLKDEIEELLRKVNSSDITELADVGEKIRSKIKEAEIPDQLREKIIAYYHELGERLGEEKPEVAVRSSATAEDLPGSSFAGQQDTYLNIKGEKDLINAIKDCYASLFTNRAISYREDKGFDHFKVKLSASVQKMGRSDIGVSGIMFTLDPDSGFENVIAINAAYGLGEYVVQGEVNPDEYVVFKENLGIIQRKMGDKEIKLVRSEEEEDKTRGAASRVGHKAVKVSEKNRNSYCLNGQQIRKLSEYGKRVEEHYNQHMDIEWLLDGKTEEIYIIQVRPETVHSEKGDLIEEYHMEEKSEVILRGTAIGEKIGSGKANVLKSPKNMDQFEEGDILVTDMTDPDWEPIMKKASGIITNKGGRTSHAAIVSRELGIPAIIGTEKATSKLKTHQPVTADCSSGEGKVWDGELGFNVDQHYLDEIPDTETDVMVNIGEPSKAFLIAQMPVEGVGLAREEFIVSSWVGEHPLSLIENGEEEKYVKALRSGIGKIGAAFYPRPVIVRLSDFKSDEYAQLKNGESYEPEEANPMIGWRGASRYYDEKYKTAFELECKALKETKEELGLDNLIIMVPFCRTVEEAEKVKSLMEDYGLGDVKLYGMAEIPSNVILAEDFAEIYDGFSIGTNDLTQLTLGVDRNSDKLRYLFDERNKAVKRSVKTLIRKAHKKDRKVGICGDAPSTYSDYAEFLIKAGIDSISVSPDVALKTILKVDKIESDLKEKEEIGHGESYNVTETIGKSSGEVYSSLEGSELTIKEIDEFTPDIIDRSTIERSLGWLAREGKIKMEAKAGDIVYSIKE